MADNYLERKMEEHRSRASVGARKVSRPIKNSILTIDTGSDNTVFVTGFECAPGLCGDVVRMLRKSNCRVAFACSALNDGRALAQSSGAQHHHVDDNGIESALKRAADFWGSLKCRMKISRRQLEADVEGRKYVISASDACSDDVFAKTIIRFCVLLLITEMSDFVPCHTVVNPDGSVSAFIG